MTATVAAPTHTSRKVVLAAACGNAIESLDFALYGLVAVYIGAAFFPTADPIAQLLATYGVFALTYFVRPLGAVVFGPLADRIGRKPVTVIVLLMMAIATVAIGVLPGYASIGVAAPVLLTLLRTAQAISQGGEFGSVASYLLEHAAPRGRGYATSWMMFTSILGFVTGLVMVTILNAAISAESMAAWGWRIPFLAAGPLALIGLYIRSRLDETPAFRNAMNRGEVTKVPLARVFRHTGGLLRTLAIGGLVSCSFTMMIGFMLTYINKIAGLGANVALVASLIGGGVAMIVTPVMGRLSDRHGRRPLLIAGSGGLLLISIPAFALILTGSLGAVAGQVLLGFFIGTLVSTAMAAMTEIFPIDVRATASSLGYMVGTALLGGTAPLISTWLLGATGSRLSPAYLLAAVALLGLVASLTYPRSSVEPEAIPDARPVPGRADEPVGDAL
jgi:MHS family proline/betaine transporter-like MFS transporter